LFAAKNNRVDITSYDPANFVTFTIGTDRRKNYLEGISITALSVCHGAQTSLIRHSLADAQAPVKAFHCNRCGQLVFFESVRCED
jgi:hypothetical protein